MIATFKTPDLVSNLKAALLAACEDLARVHMCCVRIELANGLARFVATNGHWLWLNDVPFFEVVGIDAAGKRVLGTSSAVVQIHRDDVKAILKALEKGKKAATWDVELDTAGSVNQLGKRIAFKPAETVFPPYAQILPTVVCERDAAIVTYEPAYLADIGAAFAEVSSSPSNSGGVCIQPTGGDQDPVVITSDKSTALAVLMPRRHSSKPYGAAIVARYRGEKAKAA